MAVHTTRVLHDGFHGLLGVLVDAVDVPSDGGPLPIVRSSRILTESDATVLITPVIPPPLVPVGNPVPEEVVVHRTTTGTQVPYRIDRKTPLGYVRYILHRIRVALGIPDSYVDPYEDRF